MEFSLSSIMWAIFVVTMMFFVGASAILIYHWRTYGLTSKQVISAEVVYLSVSVILIAFAVISLKLI